MPDVQRVRVRNIGPVATADVRLGDLTVFVGRVGDIVVGVAVRNRAADAS